MDMVSHATNDDGVKFMGTRDAAHVAPKTIAEILANRILRSFAEKTTWRKTHMWVWRIRDRHSKPPAECRRSGARNSGRSPGMGCRAHLTWCRETRHEQQAS